MKTRTLTDIPKPNKTVRVLNQVIVFQPRTYSETIYLVSTARYIC